MSFTDSTLVSTVVAPEDHPAAEANTSATLEEGEYEVESIMDMRGRGHTRRFLIKWKGFAEDWNTWEPWSNLHGCEVAVQTFLDSRKAIRRQRKLHHRQEAKLVKHELKKQKKQQQSASSCASGLFEILRSVSGSASGNAESPSPMTSPNKAADDAAIAKAAGSTEFYPQSDELDRLLDSLPALKSLSQGEIEMFTKSQPPPPTSSVAPPTASTAIEAVESGSLAELTRLLHTPGCDVNAANAKGETALTAALRLGSVASVRLLLHHGCCIGNWSCMGQATALPLLVKDPISVARSLPLGEMSSLLRQHSDSVSQALADCAQAALGESAVLLAPVGRLHVLPRPGVSVQLEIDRLPTLPCVLLLGNALFAQQQQSGPPCLVRLRGRCAVREVWLNSVRQQALTQAGCFVMTCAPLRLGVNTVGLVPSASFREPLDGGYRLVVRAYEVKLIGGERKSTAASDGAVE